MTLLDAPEFDYVRDRRQRVILSSTAGLLLVLFVGFWLVSGRPVDWPWNWYSHLRGRAAVNGFLNAVEKNDLPTAYGVWMHDPKWQQRPTKGSPYSYERFLEDWSSTSPDNEYGIIQSHKIAAERRYGTTGIIVATLINGRKSHALNLIYDVKTHTLSFAPSGVELYLGP